jgi:hypothetical protein
MNRILDDQALAKRFGASGRRRALERFTVERMVAETIAAYRSTFEVPCVPDAVGSV